MKYTITLKDGKTKEVNILPQPVFRCTSAIGGAITYWPISKIIEYRPFVIPDESTVYCLEIEGIYYVGETQLFSFFNSKQNPIIKLELISE